MNISSVVVKSISTKQIIWRRPLASLSKQEQEWAQNLAAKNTSFEKIFGIEVTIEDAEDTLNQPQAGTPTETPAEEQNPATPSEKPTALSPIHATSFLLKNVSKECSFRLMDPDNDADKKNAIISYLVSQGYTVAYVCSTIWGDNMGNQRSKFIYKNEDRLKWRQWLHYCGVKGLRVVLWIRSDDSPEQNKWSENKFNEYMKLLVDDLGDLVSEYCMGIECNEWGWGKDRIKRQVNYLQKISGKPVGIHTGSIGDISYAINAGADVYYLQYGFGKSLDEIKKKTKDALSKFKGRVIAAEYHKSGETDEAKRMGDAAIDAGAHGVGNGCTPQGIKKLGDRSEPHLPTPDTSGAQLLEVKKDAKEFYIQFRSSGLEAWPKGNGEIRGWITVNGKRVEQFRAGYTRQHLKNIYGKKYPVKGIKKGDTVQVALQSIDAKQNTNSLPFQWPWKNT